MTCRAFLLHAAAAAVVLVPRPAPAQDSKTRLTPYDRLYGEPVDVSISDLDQNPDAYFRRAVRTRGRLETGTHLHGSWLLRDSFGKTVAIIPVEEISGGFDQEATQMVGREVQVTGGVVSLNSPDLPAKDRQEESTRDPGAPRIAVRFWSYQGPPEKASEDLLKKAAPMSLRNLVTAPGQRDGRLVRVVGKFRGSNLYGDLPHPSRRSRGDWVLKDETFAVWVTGKKPRGDGFDLDASLKPDTDKWLEVVGKPTSRAGVTWIQAIQVTLSKPPSATALSPPPPSAERPKAPPVIVFAMPVDGDGEVATDSRFTVQFSKDMEESSFQNRVVLRYTAPASTGDRPITNMTFTYDRGQRALIVDPGMILAGGRQVELLLLAGIVDSEGLALAPRGKPTADGIVEILRYSTGI